jgi:HEPN domain-containing protein
MRTRFCLLVLVLVGVGGGPAAQAQSVSVQAEATPGEAGLQETIVYRIQVQGASLSDIDPPAPPPTTNLVLKQSTPSTRRDLSFSRGKMNRTIAFEWRYRPMRVGMARFRPADVTVNGERYTTEDIRVRVVPQGQRPSTPSATPHGAPTTRRPSAGSGRDPSGGRAEDGRASMLKPKDLFIRAQADARRAYQNEQVTVEYRLFFRPGIQLRHSRLANAWDANGFWREELDVASRPVPRQQTIDGTTYQTIVLKRVAVFPTRPGSLRVDALTIETEAYASHRTSSESYSLQSRYEPVRLSSESLSLQARPLPRPAPEPFTGAVGTFSLTTNVSTDSVRVGEAVRIQATVGGTGNLATLQPPTLRVPDAFDRYDPTITTDVQRSRTTVRGSKTFTYVVVPQTSGTFTLPPLSFAYFDPEAETYRTLRSSPVRLRVTGESRPTAVGTTGNGLPVGDIADLMADTGPTAGASARWLRTDDVPLHRRPWAYGALAVPLLLAGGLLALRRRGQAAGSAATASAPATASPADVQQHLREARTQVEEGRTEAAYRSVEQALRASLSRWLGRPASGMTRSHLKAAFSHRGLPESVASEVVDLLDACDRAQYAPHTPRAETARTHLQRATEIVRRLDDASSSSPRSR